MRILLLALIVSFVVACGGGGGGDGIFMTPGSGNLTPDNSPPLPPDELIVGTWDFEYIHILLPDPDVEAILPSSITIEIQREGDVFLVTLPDELLDIIDETAIHFDERPTVVTQEYYETTRYQSVELLYHYMGNSDGRVLQAIVRFTLYLPNGPHRLDLAYIRDSNTTNYIDYYTFEPPTL